MASHHAPEFDSLNSTPRSLDHQEPRVRFMCSFGGTILPRPHDDQLRYVGGDTRIVAINRGITFSSLLEKLVKFSGTTNISMKYQLPNEDLDALITITNDEDIENMMDEYDRLVQNNPPHSKLARLRIFLFPTDVNSRNSSISSLSSLLTGSAKREHWFSDALNGRAGSGLYRLGSEASSIVSEVPDYLFGLENSDDPSRESKLKTRRVLTDNASDPGSPAPVVSSPFCSTSSGLGPTYMPPVPDLRPIKTKAEIPVSEPKQGTVQEVSESNDPKFVQPGYGDNTMWHYGPGGQYLNPGGQHMPVYYLPGSVPPPGTVGLQQVPMQSQFVQRYSVGHNQIPVGLHQQIQGMGQVYARERNPYDIRRTPSGVGQQEVYYEVGNAGAIPMYSRMVAPGGEEIEGAGNDYNAGRVL
ncbi:PB1 domain-containing protein [Heracleum sosnowskyi]|uniref:PB1 domain-containing protein n=1 Tax=Heracleum sosnowskyi TaxID=360622 RepID=A0AAD8MAP0_9APIA|nr:PB1 domain-containing protein [Heracleum sosnowskyi]